MDITNCFRCQKPLVKSSIQSFKHLVTYTCYGVDGEDEVHCSQYIDKTTEETRYYTIHLDNFYVYYYCDNDMPKGPINPKNTVYVYHNKFPRGETVQSPFLKLSTDKVDLNKILSYNHKWKILIPFS